MPLKNTDRERKKKIFDQLAKLGATHCTVVWNGGGDSGGVESIVAEERFKIKKQPNRMIELPKELGTELENFCMDWVDNKGYSGWYNNDGGFGDATFDVEKREIDIDHSNYEQTSDSIGAEVL